MSMAMGVSKLLGIVRLHRRHRRVVRTWTPNVEESQGLGLPKKNIGAKQLTFHI